MLTREVRRRKRIKTVTDTKVLEIVGRIVADNPQSVSDYKGGKKKAISFLCRTGDERNEGES